MAIGLLEQLQRLSSSLNTMWKKRGNRCEWPEMDRGLLKEALTGLIDKITLDPATLDCQIYYQIGMGRGNKMASPRGHQQCRRGLCSTARWADDTEARRRIRRQRDW